MATPAWVRDHRRHELLTSKLIRNDQNARALERAVNRELQDDVEVLDRTVI